MFSSIFITSFIALVQSEASILGHWHWFNMGYIGIRNMVLRPCLYTTCRTRNQVSPGSNPPLLPFRKLGHFRSLH